ADATVETPWDWENVQRSLASAGDVDGDGTVDLLIGNAYESPDNDYGEGAAWLIRGTRLDTGSMDMDDVTDWKLTGSGEYESLGCQVATAGDIDGDGYSDVMVSAPGDDDEDPNGGVVLFFQGPLSGTAGPDAAQAG